MLCSVGLDSGENPVVFRCQPGGGVLGRWIDGMFYCVRESPLHTRGLSRGRGDFANGGNLIRWPDGTGGRTPMCYPVTSPASTVLGLGGERRVSSVVAPLRTSLPTAQVGGAMWEAIHPMAAGDRIAGNQQDRARPAPKTIPVPTRPDDAAGFVTAFALGRGTQGLVQQQSPVYGRAACSADNSWLGPAARAVLTG